MEKRWGLPALTARDAAAPDIGGVLTLATPRTDDPLKGVVVPKPSGKDPAKGMPSHLEQVHAELAAQLPVKDKEGNAPPAETPKLQTSADYKAFIKSRTEAWDAHRLSLAAVDGQVVKPVAAKKGRAKSKSKPKTKAKKK